MSWRRNSKVIINFVIVSIICFTSLVGVASSADVDPKITKFITEYVRVAFGPDRPILNKFESALPIAMAYHCEGVDRAVCNAALSAMGKAVHENKNLKYDFQALPPKIEIIFDGPSRAASLLNDAQLDFAGGFTDTSDSNCAIFRLSDDGKIVKVRLLISPD
ncbi:MAG: hypothetical protein ABI230_09200 [Aestuariivirga sp.]